MKEKAYSNIKPEKKFSIENIENGKCTVLFFDNIQEEKLLNSENEESTEKTTYSYDVYSIEIAYRENLAEIIEGNIEEWINDVKEKDYNEVATEVRNKRDELLYETDKYIIDDYPISSEDKEKMLEYRQKLRDLPEQEGFPYEVEFPEKPDNI